LALVIRYLRITHPDVSQLAVGAVAIGVGLVATRLVEAYGRPHPAFEQEPEQWRTVTPTALTMPLSSNEEGRSGSRPTGWTSPLPASSSDDRWSSDWGGR
jgi:hypothetical protein